MIQLNAQTLDAHADKLEKTVATTRLLQYLFPEINGATVKPGRYRFLAKLFGGHPQLLQSLLSDHKQKVLSAWSGIVQSGQSDPQFLHGLAVLYWEQALTYQEDGKQNGHYWPLSTALWGYLLCSDEFWVYFSRKRLTNRDTGERHDLENEQQEALMREISSGIMSMQSSLGNQAFAIGRYEAAQLHLHCIDICRQGQESIESTLKKYSLSCQLTPLPKHFSKLSEMAANTLDDFCRGRLQEAQKIVNDAEAIKQLPEGIRKNYKGGIAHLDSLIELNIPVSRVLQQSLNWYNDWCYDLYVTQKLDEVRNLMEPASRVSAQLIPLCTKGNAYTPENQALSQHFLFRGFS